jgi:hypothetical protein
MNDDRERWEEELRNRQRNIVFPDTVRNEGQFYRNIVYGTSRLDLAQRIGAVITGTGSLIFGVVMVLTGVWSVTMASDTDGAGITSLIAGSIVGVPTAAIGILGLCVGWKVVVAGIRRSKHATETPED